MVEMDTTAENAVVELSMGRPRMKARVTMKSTALSGVLVTGLMALQNLWKGSAPSRLKLHSILQGQQQAMSMRMIDSSPAGSLGSWAWHYMTNLCNQHAGRAGQQVRCWTVLGDLVVQPDMHERAHLELEVTLDAPQRNMATRGMPMAYTPPLPLP